MSEQQRFILAHDIVRAGAVRAVQNAPAGYAVTIAPPNRSLDQNAKLHAMLHDVAKSGIEWAGRQRSLDEWKVLFISAHAIATGHRLKIVPGIENEPVALVEATSQMSRERLSSLIEYISAWCAEHKVYAKQQQQEHT